MLCYVQSWASVAERTRTEDTQTNRRRRRSTAKRVRSGLLPISNKNNIKSNLPCTLAFVDLDQHTGLVVGICGEDLRLFARNGGVTLDEGGHHTTGGLDTEGERSNIEEKDVALKRKEGTNGNIIETSECRSIT